MLESGNAPTQGRVPLSRKGLDLRRGWLWIGTWFRFRLDIWELVTLVSEIVFVGTLRAVVAVLDLCRSSVREKESR
jgi:hypothetical protein